MLIKAPQQEENLTPFSFHIKKKKGYKLLGDLSTRF